MDETVKTYLKQLRKGEISYRRIPSEYRTNIYIRNYIHKNGIYQSGRRGYDILRDKFFVIEVRQNVITLDSTDAAAESTIYKDKRNYVINYFDSFEEYSKYLKGDIYTSACYYLMPDEKVPGKINKAVLYERKSFETKTFEDYSYQDAQDDNDNDGKPEQVDIDYWMARFYACDNCEKLIETTKEYFKTDLHDQVDIEYYLFNYVFNGPDAIDRFSIIMKYVSVGYSYELRSAVCDIYGAEAVLNNLKYYPDYVSKPSYYKYRSFIRQIADDQKNGKLIQGTIGSYDDIVSKFVLKTIAFERSHSDWPVFEYQQYFDTIEAFAAKRNNDLTFCDFSKAPSFTIPKGCKTDGTTKLPPSSYKTISMSLEKVYKEGQFYVRQKWSSGKTVVAKKVHCFDFFFDFAAFLKNDLSGADLLECEGLINLPKTSEINFNKAKITSTVCRKLNIPYKNITSDYSGVKENEAAVKNELATASSYISVREEALEEYGYKPQETFISYISDLHIVHRLINAKVESQSDIEYIVNSIAKRISSETTNILLIGGDVSSEYELYKLFVKSLRKELDAADKRPVVIFVLGNHEFWPFPGDSVNNVVLKYKKLLTQYKMHLVHNDILYVKDGDGVSNISTADLMTLPKEALRNQLREARIVLFGGTGFAGYNNDFNASDGIYGPSVNREKELAETQLFENLYNKVSLDLSDKSIIVFTHMPKNYWSSDANHKTGFVYVYGHSHKNEYYDDGEVRIYADNQVGYFNKSITLKRFALDNTYDYFADYDDGIYKITPKEYKQFYYGKHIGITFTREVVELVMLKRNGYYLFLSRNKMGGLSILNGGALKSLSKKAVNGDLEWYYNNMDRVVDILVEPLRKYTAAQERISDAIRDIGGSGLIHGCIVDIDFYNHVYVNPLDLKATGYWAMDIYDKLVYPDIPSLLENKCPELFENYTKLLESGDSQTKLAVIPKASQPKKNTKVYLDTKMYEASRFIRKMQKLNNNILTVWPDDIAFDNTPKLK